MSWSDQKYVMPLFSGYNYSVWVYILRKKLLKFARCPHIFARDCTSICRNSQALFRGNLISDFTSRNGFCTTYIFLYRIIFEIVEKENALGCFGTPRLQRDPGMQTSAWPLILPNNFVISCSWIDFSVCPRFVREWLC